MNFNELGLNPEILKAVEKFDKPTKIQELIISKILEGGNFIGQAPTGTGKTLAYLLPAIQKIDANDSGLQVLILSPTYELSMQTAKTAREVAEISELKIKIQSLIGGANINRQIDALKKNKPQLAAGSAGRILELCRKRKLNLARVKILILDEFDRLLDDQNFGTIKEVLKLLPKDFQCLMFSATAGKKSLERAEIFSPTLIKVETDELFSAARENLYKVVDFRDKIPELRKLARKLPINRGLVFINKNFDVNTALEKLKYEGLKVASLVGTADKVARKNALADFQSGKIQLLLSTDLAARGLDITEIDYVVNLDFPEDAQIYLHRAGRTARAGQSGKVLTLVDKKEIAKLESLAKNLKIELKILK